ncbi:MAG: hypothetical protein AAGE94_12185, partial [Acidobacteriota bacterium]
MTPNRSSGRAGRFAGSWLDRSAAWLYARQSDAGKLYCDGWGEPRALIDARFDALTTMSLPPAALPIWTPWRRGSRRGWADRRWRWRDGVFSSPETDLPPATQTV